jgi:hypothetical protein
VREWEELGEDVEPLLELGIGGAGQVGRSVVGIVPARDLRDDRVGTRGGELVDDASDAGSALERIVEEVDPGAPYGVGLRRRLRRGFGRWRVDGVLRLGRRWIGGFRRRRFGGLRRFLSGFRFLDRLRATRGRRQPQGGEDEDGGEAAQRRRLRSRGVMVPDGGRGRVGVGSLARVQVPT